LFVADVGQLPQILQFENKQRNCWLNSIAQMLISSGYLVETVRRFGTIDIDLVPTHVFALGTFLLELVNRHQSASERRRTLIDEESISYTIQNLRFAGLKDSPGRPVCVLEFFDGFVVPTLLHYGIDFKVCMANWIQCSSCNDKNIFNQHTCDYLLVQQIGMEDTLPNVLAHLFGPVSTQYTCLKCSNNDDNTASFSIMNCPKSLFIGTHPTEIKKDTKNFKLTEHIDLTSIVSNSLIFTYSYTRYTLQSFIVFYKNDYSGHYITYIRYKDDWYQLDDKKTMLVTYESLFGEKASKLPIILANFVQPSTTDVFSSALWNAFTNFSSEMPILPPTLCLNDAVAYFAKHNLNKTNVLNFAAAKCFTCPICRKGNLLLYFVIGVLIERGKIFTVSIYSSLLIIVSLSL
jgi:hypothetical protein